MRTRHPFLNKIRRLSRAISVVTAYDALSSSLLAKSRVDIILVGDSVATVLLGYASTRHVSLQEMISHTQAARRGAPNSCLVTDLPWKAISSNVKRTVHQAQRLMREGKCDAIKLEWNTWAVATTRSLVRSRVPVIGHVGLTPQTAVSRGGLHVRGKIASEAAAIYQSALAFENAGALAVVLECIPHRLAGKISQDLSIPTIGIGAGPYCSGQVLVFHDLVGLLPDFHPKFAAAYANCHDQQLRAVAKYVRNVRHRRFPTLKESFAMSDHEYQKFLILKESI